LRLALRSIVLVRPLFAHWDLASEVCPPSDQKLCPINYKLRRCRTAQVPKGARCQTTRRAKGREVPDDARPRPTEIKRRTKGPSRGLAIGAVWEFAPFGISRRSARALSVPCVVRALRRFVVIDHSLHTWRE